MMIKNFLPRLGTWFRKFTLIYFFKHSTKATACCCCCCCFVMQCCTESQLHLACVWACVRAGGAASCLPASKENKLYIPIMFLTFCQTHYHSLPSKRAAQQRRAAHYGREHTQGVKNLKIPDVETFEKSSRGRNYYILLSSAYNATFFPHALPRSHSSLSRLAAHSHMHGVITLARSSDDNDELLNEQRARASPAAFCCLLSQATSEKHNARRPHAQRAVIIITVPP